MYLIAPFENFDFRDFPGFYLVGFSNRCFESVKEVVEKCLKESQLNLNGILQISFRKLDIYGFYVAYDGIWDVINDRQSHFG